MLRAKIVVMIMKSASLLKITGKDLFWGEALQKMYNGMKTALRSVKIRTVIFPRLVLSGSLTAFAIDLPIKFFLFSKTNVDLVRNPD